ncbi:hypothetical protein ACFOG5_06045 [Pedobacter fastidiosus]|uniref:hypothetical protein n=1 Tax=Pedobacter fastidiosus TaxID=2765361 RepID=UPI0036178062
MSGALFGAPVLFFQLTPSNPSSFNLNVIFTVPALKNMVIFDVHSPARDRFLSLACHAIGE